MADNNKPFNVITVLCDSRRVQTIAVTCRCGQRWTERIPAELHDSTMICQFECTSCHTLYHLADKVLKRVKEDADHELARAFQVTTDNHKQDYDA
jgi:DNA-directed RNA polymerase subunit M/transcription elongation factor TFIIS